MSENEMQIKFDHTYEFYNLFCLAINLESDICIHSTIVGNKAKSLHQLKKAILHGLINEVITHIFPLSYNIIR